MKLSLPLLAGLAQAQEAYKSERNSLIKATETNSKREIENRRLCGNVNLISGFVYVLETLPGDGIVSGYTTSYGRSIIVTFIAQ